MEAEAFELDSLHRVLFEHASESTILLDPQKNILEISRHALDLLGWKRRKLIGKTVELTNSLRNDRDVRRDLMHTVFTERRPWDGIWTKVKKDAEELRTRLRAIPLFKDGQFRGVLEVFRVPTVSERLEEELSLETALSDHLMRLSRDIVLITDDKGRIGQANPRCLELAGVEKEQIVGHHLDDFLRATEEAQTTGKPANVTWVADGPLKGTVLALRSVTLSSEMLGVKILLLVLRPEAGAGTLLSPPPSALPG